MAESVQLQNELEIHVAVLRCGQKPTQSRPVRIAAANHVLVGVYNLPALEVSVGDTPLAQRFSI